MTIQLKDTFAQKKYEEELEEYREKVDARMAQPAAPDNWPRMPKRPDPLVNSEDDEQPSMNPAGFMGIDPMNPNTIGADPRYSDSAQPPQDGTAHTEPEGYETHWSAHEDARDRPFTLKK